MATTRGVPGGPGPRTGELWLTAENRRLIEAIRAGKSARQIAIEFGRSEGAIRARCHTLLPKHLRDAHTRREAPDLLGITLDGDPGYDWEQRLREYAVTEGRLHWTEAMDDALAEGWQRGRSWRELVAATGASESEVAARCKRRGWAADLKDVTDRIGFDPLGEVAARLNPEKVWVLVIDGLRAGRHISVHPTRASADKAIILLQAQDRASGAGGMDITINLVLRSPAGLEAPAA
ncbi:hypothetical protein AB0L63_10005 [Nocardia sp. NPDC051990]|uniref:hypothetical protein n=1 Tax=Nocardia sp. NPDC051990 TaxID=3155285 RepID=UPI003417A67E